MYRLLVLLSLQFCIINLFSQTIKDIEIVRFDAPFETITVMVDGDSYDYQLNEKTKLTSSKSGEVAQRYYQKGSFVDLKYKIEERQRIALKIELKSDYTPGKENIEGILESHDGDIAFIDGRKIKLDASTAIKCSGKKHCGCTKGMVYLGYEELQIGDFLSIKGKSDETGSVLADKIDLCENTFSEDDQKLRANIESSFSQSEMRLVQAPAGISVPPNSLSQGKLKMGVIEYKLHNDIQIQGYVNVIGNKVIPSYAKDPDYKNRHQVFFRFYVIDSPIPNAYAFPNGMVFIHTGLLRLMENEAQLAVILGHEVAHVTYEHAVQRYKSNKYMDSDLVKSGSKRLFSEIFPSGSDGSLKGDLIQGVGDAVIATKPSDISNLFLKENESQADRVGLFYAYSAGYDIREAISFWRSMETKTKDAGYQSALQDDVTNMLLEVNLEVGGKPINKLAGDMTHSIISNFLNTIYTSHPNAKARLKEVNDLLNSVYLDEDLSKSVGQEKFKKKTSRL